jgi:hypothetical protein
MFRDGIEKKKNKSIKKWLKITIKRIGTKLDIKIQWKEMHMDEIEERQINQENDWKQKKIEIKIMRTKFDKKKTNKIKQLGTKSKIKFN